MTEELVWLRRLRDVSQRLGSEADPGRLPACILASALELTGAERALLVGVEGPDAAGGFKLSLLGESGMGAGLTTPECAPSLSVVERVVSEDGRPVITTRPEDRDLLRASSLSLGGVRSVACVALRLRGVVRGVLYLDHRGRADLFRVEHVPLLEAFAAQAAASLELARVDAAPGSPRDGPRHLAGTSQCLQALWEEVRRVGAGAEPALICGEVGTELGLVAREIHSRSAERAERLHVLACGEPSAAVARRLLGGGEEERARLGLGTTVVLESVERLDPDNQRVVADALRSATFTPPGSARRLPVRARVLALSHADLPARVEEGSFRADLYYLLDTQRLVVPPLRQRAEDLPVLCSSILERVGRPELTLEPETLRLLSEYTWPGNVLELERELRRLAGAVLKNVRPSDLSDDIRAGQRARIEPIDFTGQTMEALQEELVRRTLEACGGVKAKAARQLGIPRSSLYHLIARYGID